MKRALMKSFVAFTFLLGVVGPINAGAYTSYSYYGSDYSYNSASNTTVYACDNSANGVSAYAEYYTPTSGPIRIYDGNGNSSGCGVQSPNGGVVQHRVCQAVGQCGPWVRTS